MTGYGVDPRVVTLYMRSVALWFLGYPEAALADADQALSAAREFGQAATLMNTRAWHVMTLFFCRNTAAANAIADELVDLANEKGSLYWKAAGMVCKGCVLALTGKASDAVQMLTSGGTAFQSTGATALRPLCLSYLARAYAELGKFDDAWRCISEAITTMETTKEMVHEAEVNRIGGDIALMAPEPDAAKAEEYFERALAVARKQQAKSLELRAATSMARLWCDQGKRDEAHALLAPIYGWFTEGFDTVDLKEAKALLDELHA